MRINKTNYKTFFDLVTLVEAISDARVEIISKQFDLSHKQVKTIAQYDPTDGAYTTWLVKQVKAGNLRFPEDGDKVKERLTQFRALIRKPRFQGIKDINQYKSYGELAQTVDKNSDVKTKGEEHRIAIQDGVKLLDKDDTYALYEVTSPEAAAKLFRHTEWCVKDPKFFKQYKPARFYYITKDGKPYVLFHPETEQLMDVYDNEYDGERIGILDKLLIHLLGTQQDLIVVSDSLIRDYVTYFIKSRWPEAEPYIIKDPDLAYTYARDVVKGRWPEAEPYIMKDLSVAYKYARDIIKGRWPEAEPYIMKDPGNVYAYAMRGPSGAYAYARDIIQGRWPEAEPYIMKDPGIAYEYARYIIQGRWPEAEPIIMKSPQYTRDYKEFLDRNNIPWPKYRSLLAAKKLEAHPRRNNKNKTTL